MSSRCGHILIGGIWISTSQKGGNKVNNRIEENEHKDIQATQEPT